MARICRDWLPLLSVLLFFDISTGYDRYGDIWTFEKDDTVNDEKYDEAMRSNVPVKKMEIQMPDVSPQKSDSYFCTAIKMPVDDTYIVGYEPHAKMKTAHHMLMFGCDDVNQNDPEGYWNCGEMGGTCRGTVNKIIYAWAKDAPPLTLPKDVGFHVGGKSQIKYVVLQVHYANVDQFKKHHKTDRSGVTLHVADKVPKYFAGIYLVAAGGPPIPPKQTVFDMDMSCKYDFGPEMHPFRFRVHAHKLGVVVTGYRVRDGKWTLIGKGDPQRPQAFYKVASSASFKSGDYLAARCTYNSMKRDHVTYIGATGADEMCNFYMMYYYDPAEGHATDACSRAEFTASDYPADTDVPLEPVKEKMHMKRDLTDSGDGRLDLTEVASWPEDELSHGKSLAGQISGVATLTTGDVAIFHRGNRKWEADTFDLENRLHSSLRRTPIEEDPVWFLNKDTGKIVGTWGRNLFHFPHGLSIDHENNIWLTDVGMHQVFKFSLGGRHLMTLGEKFVPRNDRQHFCKPTDVAIETNGDFFVSDGYCNRRVLKFSSKGRLLLTIDDELLSQTPGFPSPASLLVPHSVSLSNEKKILYVADRENGRVLSFGSDNGHFLNQYTGFGDRVFAIAISDGVLYVINGKSESVPAIHGFTFDVKNKKIEQKWSPRNEFVYPHDITCDLSRSFVYVSEITTPGKIWKFKRNW